MRLRFSIFLVASSLLLPVVGSGVALAQSATKDKQDNDASRSGNAATPPVVDADYKIGAQDVVRIDVWKEPDISRTIPVRPDGKISLPLLNDVQAQGLTAMQLAGSIRSGLTRYLTNPQVTVTVTEINSRRVYVTGEVTRTGAMPLLPNMTVLQALSSAGGFTQFAKPQKIYILRMENGQQIKYPFNYKDALNGKHPEQNILLKPGDLIVVP
jgi:polysaccharide biosynthesis/export protein